MLNLKLKNLADLLMLYAKDAATSAGMSVNAYMETATSFAAALTTSVQAAGGSMDEAVEYADTAMRDMADNANTFGSDLSSIQNAYQGFAKQNYTMLDNLKLGYGGTKAEMERLIEDANELRHEQGINNDLTIESYADIITAIHEVQTAMKITGTTSREASKTISGSIGAVKAAWTNLTIEMSKDDGDISGAFEILGENVGNVVDNIFPRVEKALGGVGDLIVKAAPQITSGITRLLPKVLPSLVKSAASIVGAVGQGLFQTAPELIDAALDNLPDFLNYAESILAKLGNALIHTDHKKLGDIVGKVIVSGINAVTNLLADLDMAQIGKNIADFVNAMPWKEIATSIINLLGSAIGSLGDIALSFFQNADLTSLFTMIGVLGAPKLLGGLNSFIGGSEGQALGEAAGQSWASTFMTGIKAFGLGWAIGSYLRDNITIGDKTLGEWVDAGTEKLFGDVEEKAEAEWGVGTTVKDEKGRDVITHDENGNRTAAFNMLLKKNAEEQAKAWSNFDLEEYRRQNHLMGYADGGRVTRPQLAIVGEKEPETIIPDSKLGSIGNTTNYITINVDGYNIKNDEEFTELLSRKLSELSVRQQRAVGGAGW